jgi:hypothetical protein
LLIERKEKGKMNKKAFGIIVILLASVLMLGIQPTRAQPGASIAILPSSMTFNNPPVNTVFNINCTVTAHDLVGGDIEVGWNTTYISYVARTFTVPVEDVGPPVVSYYPTGILYENTSVGSFVKVKDVVNQGGVGGGSAPGTLYWWAAAELGSKPYVPSFNGTGTAFTMQFKIVYDASAHVGLPPVTTSIFFTSVTLSNSSGQISPVAITNATITITNPSVVLPPEPLLKVEGSGGVTDIYGTYGSNFVANIWLMGADHNGLSGFWDVAGFDFLVTYNPALITVQAETIDPNGWFAHFWPGVPPIFVVENGTLPGGYAWIAFLGLPGTNGTHTSVNGSGIIAQITFKATYQQVPPPFIGPTCPLDIINATVAGFPHPERAYPPWNSLPLAVPLPYATENATYHAPVLFATGIDIYTNYPPTYNGTGVNMPSDMLWPQKGFTVYADVLYNLWPVQQKMVAFELIDPYGDVVGVFYNTTDSTGHCSIFIRMAWPCNDPQYEFGYTQSGPGSNYTNSNFGIPTPWKIVATVDIACHVYNDTMPFKYDYRVRIWKTTLSTEAPFPPLTYSHATWVTVTIDYGSVSMQTFQALFTITATDVSGVPFWYDAANATVGGAPWCTMLNGTITLQFYIPKYALTGYPATLYVGVLSNLPQNGGSAYYPTRFPETIVQFSIYPY